MPGARLTVEQRRTIERAYRIGLSLEQIGEIIGKHKSTVSRELARSFSAPGSRSPKRRTARNGGQGYLRVYDAERAQRNATSKARRPKARGGRRPGKWPAAPGAPPDGRARRWERARRRPGEVGL